MKKIKKTQHVRVVKSGDFMIPIVNLSSVQSNNNADLNVLAQELGDVCREIGFFFIENHGISGDFLEKTEQQVYRFFQLPEQEKMEIHISKSPYHRGYFPVGEENALGSSIKDIKEGFDMALELPLTDPCVIAGKPFHGPNTWPSTLPEFKPTLLHLYDEWRRLCEQISSLFALSLRLPSDFFVDKTDKPLGQLRVTKYPSQKTFFSSDAIGCGAHTDYGIVSIIWQVDQPGLQLQSLSGHWVDAPKIPGTFACPIGDMMQRWTNNTWRATRHRVINYSRESRHSIAFFFDPNYDCEIFPLPAFVTPENPPQYAPITMGEHVQRGFDGTFEYRTSTS